MLLKKDARIKFHKMIEQIFLRTNDAYYKIYVLKVFESVFFSLFNEIIYKLHINTKLTFQLKDG